MNKLILLFLLSVSSNLLSYEWQINAGGMCDEYANFQVNTDSFTCNNTEHNFGLCNKYTDNFWSDEIVRIAKSAANYWNEAGSEHHLNYDGEGDDNPEVYFGDTNREDYPMQTFHVTGPSCLITSLVSIAVDKSNYSGNAITPMTGNSYGFEMTLAHEFGHLLGLADITYRTDIYYRLMTSANHGLSSNLMEDDKHGVRSLYGKDDVSMISVSSSTNSPSISDCSNAKYFTTSDTDYQTYTKPALTYQPVTTKGYDYIMTWVKSNTKEVNYQFVKDCTNNQGICTVSGNLGLRHPITNSNTMTTPSVALKSDGSQAMFVWKQEQANQPLDNTNDIYYAILNNTNAHTDTLVIKKVHNNTGKDTTSFKAKTVSAPVVVWVDKWNRYVIFYPRFDIYLHSGASYLESYQWAIQYIVADENGNFSDTNNNLTENYLLTGEGDKIFAAWNPMTIDCDQKTEYGTEACLMVFNEFYFKQYDPDTQPILTSAKPVSLTTFKVLIPSTPPNYKFTVETFDSTSYLSMNNRYGYGHYSVVSKPSTTNTINNTLTRMTKADVNEIEYLNFNLYESNNKWYFSNITEGQTNSIQCFTEDPFNIKTQTRLGAGITFNKATNKYKYIWIKE